MDLYLLNTNYEVTNIIDSFSSLIWTDRYNKCGDFELVLPMEYMNIVHEDYILVNPCSEHAMIIEHINNNIESDDGDELTVSGRSLESILDRRVVWDPTLLEGSLQEGIYQIIHDAFMSGNSDSDRIVPNFKFQRSTDPRIKKLQIRVPANEIPDQPEPTDDSSQMNFLGDNVYDVITTFCERYLLGFNILLDENNKLVFSLYAGIDRSYSQSTNPWVVYSTKNDNLISSEYDSDKTKYKNVARVVGATEPKESTTESEGEVDPNETKPEQQLKSDQEKIYTEAYKLVNKKEPRALERREIYVDATGMSWTYKSRTEDGGFEDIKMDEDKYIEVLQQKGRRELSSDDYKQVKEFTGDIEDNTMYTLGVDFKIGDIIQLENNYGFSGPVRVTEVAITEDKNGHGAHAKLEILQKGDY